MSKSKLSEFLSPSIYSILVAVLCVGGMSACAAKKEVAELPEPMTERASLQYQFAYEFFRDGDLVRALAAVLDAQVSSPRNPDILNLTGLIFMRQEKFEESAAQFERALALNPKASDVANNFGTLYLQQKEFRKAQQMFERALDNPLYLYPERIYNNLGLAYAGLGNFDAAKEAYERAISLRRDYYLPYQNLGKLWLSRGERQQARPLFQEAARLCAQCSEPHYHLALVLAEENQLERAVRLFERAYELEPRGYFGLLARQFLVDSGKIADND